MMYSDYSVALREEGVDRNRKLLEGALPISVALLAEGVDRNISFVRTTVKLGRSPSSRRAWIEIIGSSVRC